VKSIQNTYKNMYIFVAPFNDKIGSAEEQPK